MPEELLTKIWVYLSNKFAPIEVLLVCYIVWSEIKKARRSKRVRADFEKKDQLIENLHSKCNSAIESNIKSTNLLEKIVEKVR